MQHQARRRGELGCQEADFVDSEERGGLHATTGVRAGLAG